MIKPTIVLFIIFISNMSCSQSELVWPWDDTIFVDHGDREKMNDSIFLNYVIDGGWTSVNNNGSNGRLGLMTFNLHLKGDPKISNSYGIGEVVDTSCCFISGLGFRIIEMKENGKFAIASALNYKIINDYFELELNEWLYNTSPYYIYGYHDVEGFIYLYFTEFKQDLNSPKFIENSWEKYYGFELTRKANIERKQLIKGN